MKQFLISLLLCSVLLSCRQSAGTAPPEVFEFDKAAELQDGKYIPLKQAGLTRELNAEVKRLAGNADSISTVEVTEIQVKDGKEKYHVLLAKTEKSDTAVAGLLVKKDDGLYFNTETPMIICHVCKDGCGIYIIEIKGKPSLKCIECEDCVKTEFYPY